MKSLYTILIFFTLLTCSAQQLEKASIHFSMFKHATVTYTINYKKNTLDFILFENSKARKVVFKETYSFEQEQSSKLFNELAKNIPDSIVEISQPALDGGGFTITYFMSNRKSSKLVIKNPNYKDTKFKEALFKIDMFFSFAYSIIKDSDGISILDDVYSSYYSDLPLRKLTDSPLEYEIWGSINMDAQYNPQFISFLNSLPKDQCVIVNCKENLSYALQEDLLRMYIIKDSNIKFVNISYLKYTREELLQIRDSIKKSSSEIKELERNTLYHLYLNEKEALNKWLDKPEQTLSLQDARESCK